MHEMRAEHDPAAPLDGQEQCPSLVWHVIEQDCATLCGRWLEVYATPSPAVLGLEGSERYCKPCMDSYRAGLAALPPEARAQEPFRTGAGPAA